MQIVKAGATDVTVTIRIIDSGDGTPETGVTSASGGLDLWYRNGATAAKTSITEADLSALTDAHADGGMLHIDDGYYRLDLPDAAVPVAGAVTVIGGGVTGMIVLGTAIQANPAADVTHWLGTAAATPTVAGVPEVDITHINGGATSGNNATLHLAKLNIVNSGGSAIVAQSSGSNGHGMELIGNGTGEGLSATGGANGHGIVGIAGASAGHGIIGYASASGFNGILGQSETTGNGIMGSGGQTTGNGIHGEASESGHGAYFAGGPTDGDGIHAVALGDGDGIDASGAGGGVGLRLTGQGAGAGLITTGGATGHGAAFVGGGTSGDGINTSATDGDGIDAVGAGTGVDIRGDITGDITGTASGNATAAALATVDDFLDTEVAAILAAVDTEVAAIKAVTDALGATAAARLKLSAENMIPGTVDNTAFTATTTILESDDITEATADHYNGRLILFTSGALLGQVSEVTDYALNGGRGRFTYAALTEAPANDSTFLLV